MGGDGLLRPHVINATDSGAVRVTAVLGLASAYRVATSMSPLAILVTTAQYTNLATAAVILSAWTLAGSASQPIWIRASDRLGRGRILVGAGLCSAALHAGLAFVNSGGYGLVVGALAGLALPPATVVARTFLSGLPSPDRRRRAFGMESALASAGFMVAPLLVGLLHALNVHAILPAIGALIAASSLGLALTAASTIADDGDEPRETARLTPSLLRITPIVASGALAYGMLGAAEVLAFSVSTSTAVASVLLAAWSASSFLSGLVFARGSLRLSGGLRQWRVFAALITGCYIVVAFMCLAMAAPVALYVAFCLSGLCVAPLLASITSEVGLVARRAFGVGSVAQIYAWFQTASWVGSSLGTLAVGLLSGLGPGAGFALASLLGLGLLVSSTRINPRPRPRDADAQPAWKSRPTT